MTGIQTQLQYFQTFPTFWLTWNYRRQFFFFVFFSLSVPGIDTTWSVRTKTRTFFSLKTRILLSEVQYWYCLKILPTTPVIGSAALHTTSTNYCGFPEAPPHLLIAGKNKQCPRPGGNVSIPLGSCCSPTLTRNVDVIAKSTGSELGACVTR